ncbi:FMN-dependent dehydrogenase family protein [Aspergillus steynii IBT 23096]|uniref:Oxidase FUB9 n=1 Tax=Aspergillus steynii IBT 23096 TaxID=1392250 RepID=A0A2I2GJW4_9EURO|nr:FMN-dependent dehydrogenase family protein [Aspergillus steynii IBT 23096]PLB53176.1 FMN-dependent dehydrogenase family protein [Aspergillus steynii IBT 23096]
MLDIQSSPHSDVLTIQDLAKKAEEALPRTYAQYYNGGAGDMSTLRDNEDAYNRYKLRPRVLRNVEKVDMSSEIFGVKVPSPLGLSPTAAHRLATPAGEIATSRAAAKNGIPMCLSTWSTTKLEDVIAQGAGNPYAMQVSFFADLSVTQRIIRRAEKAGYKALFVSVDLPVLGNRVSEARMKFSFPSHITFPNIQEGEGDLMAIYGAGYDPSIHWEKSIAWLRNNTKLQIWLKGIVTPEDVQLAIDYGLDGVVISNHGGRQLDGQPSTLDALRECGPVARGKIPLAVDGGIRRGADIFKAIAMGASMCFVGRIQIWGLAYAGESGVEHAIKIILREFKHTMMFMGCRTIADITPQHLSLLHENGILSKL